MRSGRPGAGGSGVGRRVPRLGGRGRLATLVAVSLATLTVPPAPASAQDLTVLRGLNRARTAAPATEAELETRLRREEAAYRARRADRERQEQAVRDSLGARVEREEVDTVAAGPLSVVVLSRDAAEVQARIEGVWSRRFASWAGPFTLPAQAPTRLVIQTRLDLPLPHDSRDRVMAWEPVLQEPDARIASELSRALAELVPSSVTEWLGIRELEPMTDWNIRTRALLLAPSTAAQTCIRGDAHACLLSLGVPPAGSTPGELVRRWYSADQAREMVGRLGARPVPDGATLERCEAGSDEACFSYLAGRPEARAGPLGPWDRMSFLTVALERGGPGAVRRLVTSDPEADLATTITRIAGTDLEALAAEWHRRLDAADPRHHGPRGRQERRAAYTWVGLLGLLALTNTRWRLG